MVFHLSEKSKLRVRRLKSLGMKEMTSFNFQEMVLTFVAPILTCFGPLFHNPTNFQTTPRRLNACSRGETGKSFRLQLFQVVILPHEIPDDDAPIDP